jgi:hypothetical protein
MKTTIASNFPQRMSARFFRRVLRAAIASLLLAAVSRSAYASFDDTPMSAEAAAMGGASLARQGDSAALFLNAAAGAGLANPEAYFMYNQLYTGMSGVGSIGQGFASFGVPTKLGTVGIGLSDFQASSLLDERMIGVTFARRWFGVLDVGVTGKYLYQNYLIGSDPQAASDPVFSNGTARSAFSADLGIIAHLSTDLSLGLAVRNINQPNMGLASVDPVARQIQAGLAYNVAAYGLRLTADYNYIAASDESLSLRSEPGIGLEKAYAHDMVKFRVGLTLDQISGGVGIQLGPLGFDYTFLLNRTLINNNAGTQMLGIRYRFGDARQVPEGGH